jgi:flagellar hook-length control protein FliK
MPVSAPIPTVAAASAPARAVLSGASAAPGSGQPEPGFAGEVEQAMAQTGAPAAGPDGADLTLAGVPKPTPSAQPDPATAAQAALALPLTLPSQATPAGTPAAAAKSAKPAPKPHASEDDSAAADRPGLDPAALPAPTIPALAADHKLPTAPAPKAERDGRGEPASVAEPHPRTAGPTVSAREAASHPHLPAMPQVEAAALAPPIAGTATTEPTPAGFAAALTAVPQVQPGPASAGVSVPPPPPVPASPPPATQVAAAIAGPVQVDISAPAQHGGAQTLTIQLKPVELGRVEVRIERTADGLAKIEVAVERTDTLMLLIRDQSQLHQALDQAGLPQDGRSLQFSLAADSSPTPSGSGLTADAGSGGNSGGGHRSSYGQPGSSSASAQDSDPIVVHRGWVRSGIDITA